MLRLDRDCSTDLVAFANLVIKEILIECNKPRTFKKLQSFIFKGVCNLNTKTCSK